MDAAGYLDGATESAVGPFKRKIIFTIMIQKVALFSFVLLFQLMAFAQDNAPVEMADTMRSNGKIYVVVAVILTILAGLIFYLIRLDRKVVKLAREI
jgi:undecaprenyl pyrophosphate phosphatase UppP